MQTVSSGDASLEILCAGQRKGINEPCESSVDLVLMDRHMPGKDGLETTQIIRSDCQFAMKDLPIIALTASSMSSDQRACLDAGMNDFLSKPLTIEALGSVLERWLTPKLRKAA